MAEVAISLDLLLSLVAEDKENGIFLNLNLNYGSHSQELRDRIEQS